MNCKECGSEFLTERGLHSHIARTHKVLLEQYYHKHHPRFDWQTKELINFTDIEDYFQRDFNTKDNFAKWCFKEDRDIVQKYIIKGFLKRAAKKETNFIPSHLELKTLFLPSFVGIKALFGDVNSFIQAVKEEHLLSKYNYSLVPVFSDLIPEIIIDTREQYPLTFKDSKIVKLSCGDYTTTGPLYSDVFVERKSLNDLVGTLSSGIDRFKREIKKAQDLGYYLVVVVEDKFCNALSWSPENSFSKFANGKFIFYRIREVCQEFNNIQFVFANSREEAKTMITKIFQLKDQVKDLDLEYLKDTKQI